MVQKMTKHGGQLLDTVGNEVVNINDKVICSCIKKSSLRVV